MSSQLGNIGQIQNPELRQAVSQIEGLESGKKSINYLQKLQSMVSEEKQLTEPLEAIIDRKTEEKVPFIRKVEPDIIDKIIAERMEQFLAYEETNGYDSLQVDNLELPTKEEFNAIVYQDCEEQLDISLEEYIEHDPLFTYLLYCKYDSSIGDYIVEGQSRDYFMHSESED